MADDDVGHFPHKRPVVCQTGSVMQATGRWAAFVISPANCDISDRSLAPFDRQADSIAQATCRWTMFAVSIFPISNWLFAVSLTKDWSPVRGVLSS